MPLGELARVLVETAISLGGTMALVMRWRATPDVRFGLLSCFWRRALAQSGLYLWERRRLNPAT